MSYGNNSGTVRKGVRIFGVWSKNLSTFLAGVFLILGDILLGSNYYNTGLKHVDGSFTIPLTDTKISWALFTGFALSVITTGIQIALWNFVKTVKAENRFKWHHVGAILVAVTVTIFDSLADMGGAVMMTTGIDDGTIWPDHPTMFVCIIVPLIVLMCLCNEMFLDYFFELDKPVFGGSGPLRSVRNQVATRKLGRYRRGDGVLQGIDISLDESA